jgi:tetratricopeptide (TPR) repeat protein
MTRIFATFALTFLVGASVAWGVQQNSPPAPSGPDDSSSSSSRRKLTVSPNDIDNSPPVPSTAEKDIDVASYYIHKGDPDAAIPRLEEAIQVKPKLAKPRLMLAEIYEKKGEKDTAIRYYKEYLSVYPSAPDAKKIEKKIEKLQAS